MKMKKSLDTFQSLDPVGYLNKFTNANVRPDSRPFHTVRPTTVVPAVLPRNTYGSSLIRIGDTQIISAITLSIGQPSPSAPTSGEIDVSVTFSPLSGRRHNVMGKMIQSSSEEVGGGTSGQRAMMITSSAINASDPHSIESYVKRTILSSEIINVNDLSIESGKSAWKVHVSCIVANHDGNVTDALILSCVAALNDLRLPPTSTTQKQPLGGNTGIDQSVVQIVSQDNLNNSEDSSGKREALELHRIPIPLTIGLFQGKKMADPTLAEEGVCDGMVTIVVDASSLLNHQNENDMENDKLFMTDDVTLLSIQKTGEGQLISSNDLAACVQLAIGRAHELKGILAILK